MSTNYCDYALYVTRASAGTEPEARYVTQADIDAGRVHKYTEAEKRFNAARYEGPDSEELSALRVPKVMKVVFNNVTGKNEITYSVKPGFRKRVVSWLSLHKSGLT